ncbi:MAG: ArsR family transcriptional regulator [Desulforudis sp.]|jgi:ArsR family transcriptional regulator|nr:metalloregulator ArsR/SmtB family transcription factor [Clostridia bacterium]MDQ7791602.1 metalloregulator ArsR/SmtB family transcription factor [Clostridia bacterium]RJX21407.1 MAG: ArsR family transcriptional regulator [Desulforudis sp.]
MASDIWVMQAEIFKAVGHPTRVRIVESLRDGERCVCEIMAELELEQSNVSQHLAVLKKAGILGSRKDGMKMMYWVRQDAAFRMLDHAREILLQQAHERLELLNQ